MKGKAVKFILLLALILRVVGANYGLPHTYHRDEPEIVNHAVALGETGPNPHFFGKPPFTIYALFGCYAAYYVAGSFVGYFHNKSDIALAYFRDPTPFYLIGRIFLGVVFGTATVWLLIVFARRRLF